MEAKKDAEERLTKALTTAVKAVPTTMATAKSICTTELLTV